MGRIPEKLADGRYERRRVQQAWIKPRGKKGPPPSVHVRAIIPITRRPGPDEIRIENFIGDLNSNGRWQSRDYPLDTARYHSERGTVPGSSGFGLATGEGISVT